MNGNYKSGAYWASRSDLLYYKYFDFFVRCLAPKAESIIDVGTGNSPYLEWFDWIDEKVSVDIRAPYSSATVAGITENILDYEPKKKFDICTCMQVLEHVPDAARFGRRLFHFSDLVLISVPYKWPEGSTAGHVHDPVTMEKLESWMGRKPNYSQVVREPFGTTKVDRLFAIYDAKDTERAFDHRVRQNRRVR